MTPQEVAIEAAEAVKEVANDVLRRHADADPSNQSILIGDAILPECAALILSAAAKMVKETGAVEALDLANKRATAHRLDDYYATGGQVDNDYEAQLKTSAALQSLRALTEHKP